MNEPTLWLIVGASAAVAVVLVITLALLWYCSPRRTKFKSSKPDLSAEELPTTVVDVLPHQTRNSLLISTPSPLRASILRPSEPQKLKRTRHRWSSLMPLNVARTSPSLPRIAESPISPSLTTAARNDVTSAVLQLETRPQNSRPTSASTSMDTAAGSEGGAYSSKSTSLQVPGRSPLAEKQNVRATQPSIPQPPRTLHANRWSTMYGLKRSTFVQGGSWQGKRGL